VEVVRWGGLRGLPAFDPDLDTGDPALLPPEAAAWRGEVGAAGAVLVSSPEYAHGIPGALKNALDWLVGSTEFPGKPVGLLNTSPWSTHAPAQLAEVLRTMNARLVDGARATVPLLGRSLDGPAIAADPGLAAVVRGAVAALTASVSRS
jgi:NAD(P)H-dependent FMN reductase